jgi:hypothetical protein
MKGMLMAVAIAATANGVVVAHDGRIDFFDANGRMLRWSSPDGVRNPTAIATSAGKAIVLDALANQVAVVDLAAERAERIETGGETPTAAVFAGSDIYVLERDSRTLKHLDGERIATPADPAFMAVAGDHLLLYARTGGELLELALRPLAVERRVSVPPFASDMEVEGGSAYLVYPRARKLVTVALDTLKVTTQDVGAVPVDLATAPSHTFTSPSLAIADPSSKRVWVVEGAQTPSQAFARGFLRGLLGLGLSARDAAFPTGVDRVTRFGEGWIAYDSASGSLYAVTKGKSTLLARDVSANGYAITSAGVLIWNDAVRRLQKIADR